MYNDVIMTLDFIGFISIFAVLVMVTLTKKRSILKSPVFLLLMAFISIYQGLLFVEWTNITHSLEFLENYVGSLLPLWWLFSFHVLTQSALIRDLTMSESHLRLAMKDIRDSEERFKSIYENAPYSISISRYEDGRYVDANSVFYERRGLTKEELLTYKVKDLLGYSEEEGQSLRKQVYETGGLRNKEISVRGKNDEMIYLLYSAVPIQYAGEQCILSIMTDISDKKMAELALRASEEKYRTIFEHSPIGIFRSTWEGKFLEANPTLARMLGYESREELLDSVDDLARGIYPNPVKRRSLLDVLREDPEDVSLEIDFKRRDGIPFYAIIKASVQVEEGGRRVINGTIEDITKRKVAEHALKASEEKFSRLFQLSPDAIVLINLNNDKVLDVNETFSTMLGYSREDAVGHTATELGMYARQFVREEMLDMLLWEGHVRNTEMKVINKNGMPLICSMACQRLEVGGEPCLLAVIRDITEMKKMQEMMVQTEKMVSVGGIAAGIAHEINNPLGVVLQAAQNLSQRTRADFAKNRQVAEAVGLEMECLQAYMRERKLDAFIADIQEAAKRTSEIIRHMLDFTRRSESQRKVCEPVVIVEKALDLAQNDYDLKKSYDFKKIKVQVESEDGLPEINCTETEIEQVLLNLFRNAAQAMANGEGSQREPCIDIRLSRIMDGVRIEVWDNGPGIPVEIQRRVFEPFFTTKAPGVGTGLGLSVSYFIITKGHGGRFSVKSSPECGTCFTIDLPTDAALETQS